MEKSLMPSSSAKRQKEGHATEKHKHIGSLLDDFLVEEGILEEARTVAHKEALAWRIQQISDSSEPRKSAPPRL
jgi:hypothetical protein